MSNYRELRNYENQQIMIYTDTDGEYGFPIVRNNITLTVEEIANSKWLSFNELLSTRRDLSQCIVHFFIDDYQFARLWKSPLTYLDKLKKVKAVVMTDFSMYSDFPKALSIYAKFKNHWIARFLQDNDIQVIPILCWCDKDSFSYAFNGYSEDCKIFAISTQGCFNNKEANDRFFEGLYRADKVLSPETIFIYVDNQTMKSINLTDVVNPIRSNVIFISNEQINRLRKIGEQEK